MISPLIHDSYTLFTIAEMSTTYMYRFLDLIIFIDVSILRISSFSNISPYHAEACAHIQIIYTPFSLPLHQPLEEDFWLVKLKQFLYFSPTTLSTGFKLSNAFSEVTLSSTPSTFLPLPLADFIFSSFVSKLTDGCKQRFVLLADKLSGGRKSLENTSLLCFALLFF